MAYTLNFTADFGSHTGLTLNAKLYDTAGTQTGSTITSGFVEIGDGVYSYNFTTIPDNHRGSFVIYDSSVTSRKVVFSVNPEEAENIDVKTSTRSTVTTAQVNSEVDTALSDYDSPTNAEFTARTLATADYATSANQTTILNRIGSFTGSGVNTILGFFQAIMRSDATLPSDIGGSFDDSTDSLQAIRDRGDANWITATGFSTHSASDVFSNVIESGKTFSTFMLDIWSVVVGNANSNDASSPTTIAYDSPDDSVQVTHTLTDTTRSI